MTFLLYKVSVICSIFVSFSWNQLLPVHSISIQGCNILSSEVSPAFSYCCNTTYCVFQTEIVTFILEIFPPESFLALALLVSLSVLTSSLLSFVFLYFWQSFFKLNLYNLIPPSKNSSGICQCEIQDFKMILFQSGIESATFKWH